MSLRSLAAWLGGLFSPAMKLRQQSMARASWNGVVLADSEAFHVIEGNVYFPPASVKQQYLRQSQHRTVCFWKGTAHYYDVIVGGKENLQAAWFYPHPSQEAAAIKDHVAFWHGVRVEQ